VRDLEHKVTSWNKGAEKLYGWTSEEAEGKTCHTLLQTEFPKPREEIQAQLLTEMHFSGEVVQFARDGRRIVSLCRWVLDPETSSILTSYTDSPTGSEQRKHWRRARCVPHRRQYRQQPYLDEYSQGEMQGVQPGWSNFTGQTEEEYQGYGWASAVHPD
jgi:PAS domain-containing protein